MGCNAEKKGKKKDLMMKFKALPYYNVLSEWFPKVTH